MAIVGLNPATHARFAAARIAARRILLGPVERKEGSSSAKTG
jgi:hypothetical protein